MDHFWVDVFILVWEFGGPSTTSGWLNKVIWLCSRVCCLTIKHTPPPLLPPLIMVPLCTPSMCVGSVGPAPTSRGLTSSRSPSSPLPAREGPSSLLQRSSSSAVGQRASLLVLHGARVPQKKFLGSPLYFSVDFFIKLLVSVDWLLGVLCLWFDLIALGYLFLGWELILNMFDT